MFSGGAVPGNCRENEKDEDREDAGGEGLKGLVITSVMEDSIASEMKLAPGDRVAAVNGQEIRDVIDFRYFTAEDVFTLLVQKADDEVWELEIEREPGERLGIEFEQIAADGLKTCKNHCLFCFV
ncbi:MAG: PDZ domain-containing protein, partial [Peptococcaceae bacterium]|nr:PDZ domain-containing protein [Peptococcaceae bacterium]